MPAASLDLGADLSAVEQAGSLGVDAVMAVLVYEDLTLQPVLGAWAASGARLVAEGAVDPVELDLALGDDTLTP